MALTPRHEALQYYFYFMQERMHIFRQRYNLAMPPYTDDPVLQTHKFTNVYRVLDRVSQYLIKNVIYNKAFSSDPIDILLRVIIFKVFNTIPTRDYLIANLGDITVKNFNPDQISRLLSSRKNETPIFSAAYIMTGSHGRYNTYQWKHEKRLHMIQQELIDEAKLLRIVDANSLDEIYRIFSTCSMIGPFLAYQYTIDCNYTDVINFDENSFVVAGIGAKRGIQKCFQERGGYSDEECIRRVHEHFHELQKQYGYNGFQSLGKRLPTLIDLQNCFCETDKYLRVKMPTLQVGNSRIKQKFRGRIDTITYFFPPKRNLSL